MSGAKDLIEKIANINIAKQRIKNESSTPEVGIFWWIGNEPIMDTTPVREGDKFGDFIYHAEDHFNYWEKKISPNMPIARNKDYDYFPRGRVIYNAIEDVYYLYADRCIRKNIDNIKKIAHLMHLPVEKTKVLGDRHYQCARCNKNYVD